MATIDPQRIRDHCRMQEEDYRKYGKVLDTPAGPLIYADRGSTVLGICHLDTVYPVQETDHFAVFRDDEGRACGVGSPHLDDRLGAYVLLDLLPALGITLDVLLTTGEECGNSTAAWFDPPEGRYHWLVEFDRRGADAVTYGLESGDWLGALRDAGYQIGTGSYSDLATLAHLGVCGVNIGVGYHCEHTRYCHADLYDLSSQVRSFVTLFRRHQGTRFPLPQGGAATNWRYGLSDYDDALSWWTEEERHQARLYGLCDEDIPDLLRQEEDRPGLI